MFGLSSTLSSESYLLTAHSLFIPIVMVLNAVQWDGCILYTSRLLMPSARKRLVGQELGSDPHLNGIATYRLTGGGADNTLIR